MRLSLALAVVPRALIIIVALVLVGALAAAVVVASQPTALPSAVGPARNGLLAYDSAGDIWVMNPDGTGQHQLTTGQERDVSPVWSRDGTQIAFWSFPPAEPGGDGSGFVAPNAATADASLVVIDSRGSDRRVLADGLTLGTSGVFEEPAWDPKGSRIAIAHREDGTIVIDIVSVDGGDTTRLDQGDSPRWSPDGSLIAYHNARIPAGVMVASPDGVEPRRVTEATGSGGAFYFPSWSPDSSELVFYAEADGAHDVWVVAADGTDEHAISTEPDDEYWPAWSPTGDRIAFSRVIGNGENRPHFVVTDSDGSEAIVLLPENEPEAPGMAATWSPDGTILLGGAYVPDPGSADSPSGCSVATPCPIFELHLIDAADGDPVTSIPISDNVGMVSWQRLAD